MFIPDFIVIAGLFIFLKCLGVRMCLKEITHPLFYFHPFLVDILKFIERLHTDMKIFHRLPQFFLWIFHHILQFFTEFQILPDPVVNTLFPVL